MNPPIMLQLQLCVCVVDLFPQASCRTTSSASRQASCCPRCRRWTTCSPGSGCCSCWPSPAWLCCPVPSSATSVRGVSNWMPRRRTGSSPIRRSSDLSWLWLCVPSLTPLCVVTLKEKENFMYTHVKMFIFVEGFYFSGATRRRRRLAQCDVKPTILFYQMLMFLCHSLCEDNIHSLCI